MRCRTCEPVPEEVRRAADLLERRWLLSVVYAALAGAVRFNEFKQAVEGISSRTLTDRLRVLERAGVLERRVTAARPPLVEYRLTEEGRRLAPVVEALRGFARSRPDAGAIRPRPPGAVAHPRPRPPDAAGRPRASRF